MIYSGVPVPSQVAPTRTRKGEHWWSPHGQHEALSSQVTMEETGGHPPVAPPHFHPLLLIEWYLSKWNWLDLSGDS